MEKRLGWENRAFRATRTNDLNLLYKPGIKCFLTEEIEDRACAVFLNGRNESADEKRFSCANNDIDARKKVDAIPSPFGTILQLHLT